MRLIWQNTEDVIWQNTEDSEWTDGMYLTVLTYLVALFIASQPEISMNSKAPEAVIAGTRPDVSFSFQARQ